ncbi:NTP transferase domain-containing protein [Clostridium cochlearium]|uniref:cytidylyltransferase domain-containing protein n=1 Tax=Clostridium cochlearium TaxID=1494 RepID=UPI001459C323|nr:glycosyltransferase family protein [Clostridium cochlearium]NME95933.1 NTP transferase domain-containing protein [Clostridium cochlearium]
MKVVCIVQARVGSTRLPGKVLKKICGKTVLEHDIDRLKRIKNIDEIIIATTTLEKDNAIVKECQRLGVKCFRGSEEDVLSRYYYAAKENNADVVVRVTSDCPLIDPEVSEKIIQYYLDNKDKYDYVSNTIERTYPRGLDTEVFSFEALEKSYNEAKKQYEREHVTPYIYQNADKFKMVQYKNERDYSNYRWTLDTQEDYKLINIIYNNLYEKNKLFCFNDILQFIDENFYLTKINDHIQQKKLGE